MHAYACVSVCIYTYMVFSYFCILHCERGLAVLSRVLLQQTTPYNASVYGGEWQRTIPPDIQNLTDWQTDTFWNRFINVLQCHIHFGGVVPVGIASHNFPVTGEFNMLCLSEYPPTGYMWIHPSGIDSVKYQGYTLYIVLFRFNWNELVISRFWRKCVVLY